MDLKSNMNMDWKSIFFVVDYETIYQKRTKMVNNRDSRSVYLFRQSCKLEWHKTSALGLLC